jgi:prephenate dehydrogenase
VNLTIVGLGMVGTSVGLALKAATSQIPIVGHDPEPMRVQRAKRLGAIDKSHWNLPAACEEADIVLLDLSLGEMEKTLLALREQLRDQALVIDTLSLKRPAMELAARILPPTVRFVGGHIVSRAMPAGEGEPEAALLRGATFYLVASEGASAEALDRASSLATALGAAPLFIGAEEHDGLVAAATQLPLLSAAALLDAVSGEAGWEDRAGAVGGEFAALAAALLDGAPDPAPLLLANRENALYWLDVYAQRLALLRQSLADQDQAALERALGQALKAGQRCLPRPKDLAPEPGPKAEYGSWRDMFLGGLGRLRRPPEQASHDKDKGPAGDA